MMGVLCLCSVFALFDRAESMSGVRRRKNEARSLFWVTVLLERAFESYNSVEFLGALCQNGWVCFLVFGKLGTFGSG